MDETDVDELVRLYNSEDGNDPDGENGARGITAAMLIGALIGLLYAGLRLALGGP
jgi:hypothetical protein